MADPKIKLKRSSVLDGGVAKAPDATQLDFGELALNYNVDDPSVFVKDSDGNIVKIAGGDDIGHPGYPDLPAGETLDDRYVRTDGGTTIQGITGTGGFYVQDSIGVGTSTPQQRLEVKGTNARVRITDSDTTAATSTSYLEFQGSDARSAVIYTSSGGLNLQADSAGGNNIRFLTSGSANEWMRLDSIGNLGVGTTDPKQKFVVSDSDKKGFEVIPDLSGDVTLTAYDRTAGTWSPFNFRASEFTFSPGGTAGIYITNDARLGVGVAGPSEKLEVLGAVKATDAVLTNVKSAAFVGTDANGKVVAKAASAAPGDGALTIKTAGEAASASGTFTANQSSGSTLTLPTIRYTDLSGKPTIGNGSITIVQPGTTNQTFSVNQTGNTTITLKNDNTVPTVNNGALTLKLYNQSGDSQTGSFTANGGNSTITLPQIDYTQLKSKPTIPAAAGNGTITIVQPGTTNQTFTVNQTGNKTITLKNDNTTSVNLGYTANGNNAGVVTNDKGNDATIPVATTTVSGLLTGTDKTKLNAAVTLTGAQTVEDKTLLLPTIQGTIIEDIYSATWSGSPAINPNNGSFHVITLSGSITPSQSNWSNGQSVTLQVTAGSRSINWGTLGVKWSGGSAPTLASSGPTAIQLWKLNNTIYGATVGDLS